MSISFNIGILETTNHIEQNLFPSSGDPLLLVWLSVTFVADPAVHIIAALLCKIYVFIGYLLFRSIYPTWIEVIVCNSDEAGRLDGTMT